MSTMIQTTNYLAYGIFVEFYFHRFLLTFKDGSYDRNQKHKKIANI